MSGDSDVLGIRVVWTEVVWMGSWGLAACQGTSPAALECLGRLWDSLEQGGLQREEGCHPSQRQTQPPAAWRSAKGGCLETLGSRCLNPSWGGGLWQLARWAGGQGALLDAQGWVGLWKQSPCPGAPAGHPRCGVNSPGNSCRL